MATFQLLSVASLNLGWSRNDVSGNGLNSNINRNPCTSVMFGKQMLVFVACSLFTTQEIYRLVQIQSFGRQKFK